MKYALDENGHIIDAQLLSSSKSSFSCPTCGNPVIFRRGDQRENHFAHLHQRGATPECEDYHPSNGTIAIQNIRAQIKAKLQLYIIIKEDRRGFQSSWELNIRIPASQEKTGELTLYSGLGNVVVPLSNLYKKPVYIPVKPGLEKYQLRLQGITDQYFSRKIQEPCAGLSKHSINTFRFSLGPSRRLNGDEPVFWGRRYILISHGDIESVIPSMIRKSKIGSLNNFEGTVIELPPWLDINEEQRTAISSFVRVRLGKEIEIPPPSLVLLTPHLGFDEESESFLVDENASLFFGIYNEKGGNLVTNISLHDDSGKMRYAQVLDAKPPLLLAEEVRLPFYEYTLSENRFESLSIRRVARRPKLVRPDTVFTFALPNSRMEERIPCESDAISTKLSAVLDGTLSLTSIVATEGTPIEILTGTALNLLTKVQRFNMNDTNEWQSAYTISGKMLAEKIQSIIRSMQAIEIRIANYTSIAFGPLGTDSKDKANQAKSDHIIKNSIVWLFIRSGKQEDFTGLSIDDLFEKFLRIEHWPVHLIPRARQVRSTIKRMRPTLFKSVTISGEN